MPVAFALGVLLVAPRIAPTYSHNALIAAYVAARANDTQRLFHVGEIPQSTEFYARERLSRAVSPAELERYLREGHSELFALTEAQLAMLPDVRARLTPLGHYGRYTLQDARPRSAPAP